MSAEAQAYQTQEDSRRDYCEELETNLLLVNQRQVHAWNMGILQEQ